MGMEGKNGKDKAPVFHLDPKETPLEEIENTPEGFNDCEVFKEEALECLQALQDLDERYWRR